jgi:hypothetical protein
MLIPLRKPFILIVIFVSLCIVSANDSQDNKEYNSNPNKGQVLDYLESGREKIFHWFEKGENYFINVHNIVVKDLGMQYPFDLVFFFFMGFFIYYLKSLFTLQNDFIYNSFQQPDLTDIINNVQYFIIN